MKNLPHHLCRTLTASFSYKFGKSNQNHHCKSHLQSLENQVAICRHYGSLRKFTALEDDRAAIRTTCLQDFAIPNDTPEARAHGPCTK